MQAFRHHREIGILAIFLVVIISISAFIVHNTSNQSPSTSTSPTPTQTPTPDSSPTPNLTPTATATSPPRTPIRFPTTIPGPEIDMTRHVGEITQYQGVDLSPINAVYENAVAGLQYINQTTYQLKITGLVDKTLNYTYNQVITNHPTIPKVATILCVEGWSATLLWEGVSVNTLLMEAGINPQTTVIIFHASDGYTTALPLDYIVQNNIIIAYRINNVTLTPEKGWPFMLVGQNEYGYKWIKWLTEIEASNDTNYLGYWESRGYPNDATINQNP